jgi:hypothetical protein
MAAKLKIEKRGDEILNKSSPLKLLSQSQPHLGQRSEMPDTSLEGDHPRIISAKFG